MPLPPQNVVADEDLLDQVIADYLESVRLGRAPSRQELLARYPGLAGELKSFFANKDRFERLAATMPGASFAPVPLARPDHGHTEITGIPSSAAAPAGVLRSFRDYELLTELGRGGMGVVYKARQKKLNRIVALKMILTGEHAGAHELARFRAEAEAVARLQHPNIVQIYEVGEEQGRPYFSLEFVDGGSLAQRIAGQPQPTRQAAALVQTLARAAAYAHQQGIVHRDLKPANVLLTAQGMPKITDFGLAKRLEQAEGDTKSGAILGTPAYIAPEQAAGKTRAIGPAVDVYALGAILYELLTGRPPFRGESALDTVMQVMTEEAAPPTQLCPRVPRDLETICQKCLQKDPAKRYPSANALADDLRRFLAGESIQARPVGTAERCWRWCRRRPLVAGLLLALLLLFMGGAASVTWQWRRAEHLRQLAEANAAEAQRQRAQAERERARAEENYQQARKVVDEFFTRVSEEKLLQVPGLQPLRKQLLESALKYYQEFLQRQGVDPAVQAERAAAYYRVGQITREMGSNKESFAAHQKAHAIREELVRADPRNGSLRLALAESELALGSLHTEMGQRVEARRALKKAQESASQLLRADPDNQQVQEVLSVCHARTADLLRTMGQFTEALRSSEQAHVLLERLVQTSPTAPRQRNLAACNLHIAYFHKELGRPAEALKFYTEAGTVLERLVAQYPAHPEFQRDLAGTSNNIGILYSRNGKPVDALKSFEKARVCFDRLAADNPTVVRYQHDLAASLGNIANIQAALKQPAEALQNNERARGILEQLLRGNPTVQVRNDLARIHNNLGNLHLETNRPAEALRSFRQAHDLRQQMVGAAPDSLADRSELGQLEHNQAKALEKLGRPQEALAAYRLAIEHQRAVVSQAPEVAQYRAALSTHYRYLGRLQRELVRPADAAATCRERQKLWPQQAEELYRAAGELALCIPLVGKGKTSLTAAEDAQRRQYATEAIQVLRQAVRYGFKDLARLQTDADLAPLRGNADFQKLQAELEPPKTPGR